MTTVLLDSESVSELKARFALLARDTKPLWGRRNSAEMVAHMRRNVEVALGEVAVEDKSNFVSRIFIKWYMFNSGVPWQKNKIQAPKVLSPPPEGDLEEERKRLFEVMSRFVDTAATQPKLRNVHPFFGPVKLSYWRRMLGIHMDYHLKQFGV